MVELLGGGRGQGTFVATHTEEKISLFRFLRIRRNDIFNGLTSVLYFVFLLGSSLFYPIDPLPRAFRMIALANPITWQVDLLRYGTIGYGDPRTLLLEAAAFTLFAVGCFVIAVKSLNAE
jgi:ABC-type polysaccharide/polyol phosphate export permease